MATPSKHPHAPAGHWNREVVAAIALAAVALAIALGAYLHLSRMARIAEDVRVQSVVAEAYERRALRCLDRASAALGDAALHERAEKSLSISRGITLCLVRHRDRAQLAAGPLAACIAEVEAANVIPGAGGGAGARPAC